ncbi:MAG: hypothetical protein QQN41_11415, partial [Nitrosopumilus sp.]
ETGSCTGIIDAPIATTRMTMITAIITGFIYRTSKIPSMITYEPLNDIFKTNFLFKLIVDFVRKI